MSKKRAIVSFDKMSIDQKKLLLQAFPDGFADGMTTIKTPTGETLEALLWETEEIIYLVKINKPLVKAKSVDDDDDDDFEEDEDLANAEDAKVEEDDDDNFDDDLEDEYDVADKDEGEDEDDKED